MKLGQLIELDKYFPSKTMQKMRQGDLFILKKNLI